MCKPVMWTVIVTAIVAPAFGQSEFKDDFTTVATYDSASFLNGCAGAQALTKYTVLEGVDGDIFNNRGVSGGGALVCSDREQQNSLAVARYNILIVGAVPLVTCPGAPDQVFLDPDLCVYGGISLNYFDVRSFQDTGYGNDLRPGVAGVDDDCDGLVDGSIGVPGVDDDTDTTIDEWNEAGEDQNESPIHAGGDTYGPPYSDGGAAGCPNAPSDGLPGVAGVDDDGDGTIDEYDELGLGNDSDDNGGRQYLDILMRVDLNTTSLVWLNFDMGSGASNCFSIRHMVGGVEDLVEASNEIVGGFYQPGTPYNYAFCNSGTCFGAVLWTGTDISNPNETVGPIGNSQHTGTAPFVGFLHNAGAPQYQRVKKFRGNSNFDDAYWVCEGTLYPSPSADLDDDKDVDGFDFLTFSNCYNGSNKAPLGACANLQADLDKDGDVDGFDFLSFSNCYNGSNRKPLAACFPPNLTNCGS